MFLKFRAKKSSLRLGNCKKLAAKFCGPYEILKRIGPIVYELALPPNIRVHNVFHVALLNKYVPDPNHIINWHVIQVEPEGDFQVQPIAILDRKSTMLRNRAIGQVNV